MFDRFPRSLLYGARTSIRSPGLSTAVVLTLALGVAAGTAMFSLVYGVLFRPLPYRDANQLVTVRMERALEGAGRPVRSFFPLADLPDLRDGTRAFQSIAFHATDTATLTYAGFAGQVHATSVSPSFFVTAGGALESGRWLSEADSLRPAAVVSRRLSDRLFGTAGALTKTVRLGSRSYEIVGIAHRTFQLPSAATDIWIPAHESGCCPYAGLARLTDSASAEQAASELNVLVPALTQKAPRVYGDARMIVSGLREELTGDVRKALWILLAAVGLVLGVACVNAANLILVRHAARARDTAVRMALGASRMRLCLESLAEAAWLAAAAGVLGTLLAWTIVDALTALDPGGLPAFAASSVRVDLPVLIFAIAIVTVTTCVVGLLPAVGAGTGGNTGRIGAASIGAGPVRRRLQNGLVVAQLAISLTLLVGATLLGRSLIRLTTTDLGVRPDHVATAAINLAFERRLTDAQQKHLVDALLARIQALPGVVAAGAGSSLPPNVSTLRLTLKRSGDTVDYQAAAVPATPGYFQALGVRLLEGRLFSNADGDTDQPVMIMTADTARRFFGNDPLGRSMPLPVLRNGVASNADVTLVGVIDNVKYAGLLAAPDDVVYRPLGQQRWPLLYLVARTSGDPAPLASMLRGEIAAVDPAIAVSSVTTLERLVAAEAAQPRFRASVVTTFAVLTLAIAAAGLYGVVAHTTAQRTKELGVRMALGAGRADLFTLVFAAGGRLVGAGLFAGLAGALALTRVLQDLLYGVEPTDAFSFGIAAGLLVIVAGAATCLPARRASRLDPAAALRCE